MSEKKKPFRDAPVVRSVSCVPARAGWYVTDFFALEKGEVFREDIPIVAWACETVVLDDHVEGTFSMPVIPQDDFGMFGAVVNRLRFTRSPSGRYLSSDMDGVWTSWAEAQDMVRDWYFERTKTKLNWQSHLDPPRTDGAHE